MELNFHIVGLIKCMFANCAVQEASKPEKQEGNYNEGGSKVGDQAGKSVQEAAPST